MTALVDRIGFEVDAIDVFCGFGGSSQGIHAAGATVRAAANHNELAIECHATNFPDTDHWQVDMVDSANPQVINRKGNKVAGRYLDAADLPRARYAWFSPACTNHSQANAKKVYERGYQLSLLEDDDWDEQAYVNSERSRVTMSCVLRYCDKNRPEIVAVENVLEVTKWGPRKLGTKSGDGTTFRWWLTELRNLGYETRLLFLNSMFFPPCPQSRDRVYIVAWRRGNRAPDLAFRPTAFCTSDRCGGQLVDATQTWKRPTAAWMGLAEWGKYLDQYDYRCPTCHAVVHPASWMALSAIDFSNLGETLGERKRLPAPNTLERIRRALVKYWHAPPVMMPASAGLGATVTTAHPAPISTPMTHSPSEYAANRSKSIAQPLPTLAQRNTQALALMIKNNGAADEAGYRGHHTGSPLGAVTAHPTQSLVALIPNRTNNIGRHGAAPTAPIMTSATQAVILAAAGNTSERVTRAKHQTRARHQTDPLFTQSTTDEFAVAALPVLRGNHPQEGHVGEQTATVSTCASKGSDLAFISLASKAGDRDHTLVLLPWIDQWRSEPALITEQLAVVTTHLRHSLASIEPFDGKITDELLMQVRFRMLQPDPELRRAMAFSDDYILLGNKGEMTAGLGNAVTPPVASWITRQCLATLAGEVAA